MLQAMPEGSRRSYTAEGSAGQNAPEGALIPHFGLAIVPSIKDSRGRASA